MSNPTMQPDDIQAILDLEKETFDAIRDKDAEKLGRILDDAFIYRSPAGPEARKEEFIKAVTGLPVRLLSVWGENLQVNIYGETAVLTGVQHARVETEGGTEAVSSVAFTDIFIKRTQGWVMALAFGVELPSNTQPATEGK